MARNDPMRNYKSLDDQRKSRDAQQVPYKMLEVRLGFVLFILLILAFTENVPNFWIASAIVFAILVGRIIWRIQQKRHPNANSVPVFNVNKTKKQKEQEDVMPWEQ